MFKSHDVDDLFGIHTPLKNPVDLASDQKTTLAVIAKINNPLYRAYLLELRAAFQTKGAPGRALLAGWLAWAQRCRIPEFVKLAQTIKRFLPSSTTPSTTA
jgi:transposase